jgi:hypothetical protein
MAFSYHRNTELIAFENSEVHLSMQMCSTLRQHRLMEPYHLTSNFSSYIIFHFCIFHSSNIFYLLLRYCHEPPYAHGPDNGTLSFFREPEPNLHYLTLFWTFVGGCPRSSSVRVVRLIALFVWSRYSSGRVIRLSPLASAPCVYLAPVCLRCSFVRRVHLSRSVRLSLISGCPLCLAMFLMAAHLKCLLLLFTYGLFLSKLN